MASKDNKYKYRVLSVEQGFVRSSNGQAKPGFVITFIPDGTEKEYTVESEVLDDTQIDSMIQDKIHRINMISSLGG